MRQPRVSIIFGALNEEKWFVDALRACQDQSFNGPDVEIVLVDSGSTDGTLEIADRFGCKIVSIKQEEFSFGRSLNYGCKAAPGDYLVFTLVHCVPSEETWLENLIASLEAGYARKLVMAFSGGILKLLDTVFKFNSFYDFRHSVCSVEFAPFGLR